MAKIDAEVLTGEAERITGLPRGALWSAVAKGLLSSPRYVSERKRAWRLRELLALRELAAQREELARLVSEAA